MANTIALDEIFVTKEDKEKIIAHWNEIAIILNKYEMSSRSTSIVTVMQRVKMAAHDFSKWVDLLQVNEKDNMFSLVEASQLSVNDEFMKYEPVTDNQRELKKYLIEAINSGLSDFCAPRLDPSFNEEGTDLVFEVGKRPAVGKSYNWWEEKAKQYLPGRGSRLGTKTEYVAFLGMLIKKMIASGWWSVPMAWKAVCDDSKELGHYCNSENAKHRLDVTGSREICGFCDLANTYKILAWDKKSDCFWIAGGNCDVFSFCAPLTDLFEGTCLDYNDVDSIGWIVLSK